MAVLFCESFESYDPADETNTLKRVWGHANDPAISTAKYKTGSQCLQPGNSDPATWYADADLSNEKMFLGFAFLFTDGPEQESIVDFMSIAGAELSLVLLPNGRLALFRDTTLLISGSEKLFENTWYYIEIKALLSNSTSSSDCIVKINEVADITIGAGVDTWHTGGSLCGISLNSEATSQQNYFDDIYIVDDTGSDNNTFLGECAVECRRPDGNGNSSQWDGSDGNQVDNYLLVDDQYVGDSAEYIEGQNAAEVDLFTYQNLALDVLSVRAVKCISAIEKTAAGPRTIRTKCRSNGANYNGDTETMPEGGYRYMHYIWEQDPDTSALWLEAAVNAAEFGVEVVA
jgi:hypothetical protein